MISESDKSKYLHILTRLKAKHANIFTQKELANHFNISLRKMSDFLNGKIFDFWLLLQYAAIIGIELKFWLNEK